ncbi:MAG TPA: bh protein [Actinobacteria bacterium]|nr:bh protein [Actinomycetota bacterium]
MLKDEENKIILFCINCNEETEHSVNYIGEYLKSIKCEKCKKKFEIDRRHLRTVFAEDFIDRVLSKPHRMSRDFKEAMAYMVPFFPKRLFHEPKKVIKEIIEVLRKKNGD